VSATKRMYVWYELPSLRDYSDGLMCVIASSKDQAIKLAADQFCGRGAPNSAQLERRTKFLAELMGHEPEVVSVGAVYKRGGS
jgi:hypothetical protein